MLRSLISVVETGSITETARRLGRTQPAITLQLQRLEELTGKAIFIHEGRRLFLTSDPRRIRTPHQSASRRHLSMIAWRNRRSVSVMIQLPAVSAKIEPRFPVPAFAPS